MIKKMILVLCAVFLFKSNLLSQTENDTLRIMEKIQHIIENAPIKGTTIYDWEGQWPLDGWEQIKLYSDVDDYLYFHVKQYAYIEFFKDRNTIKISGYTINFDGGDKSVVDIHHQSVSGSYGEHDAIEGKIALLNDTIYYHFFIERPPGITCEMVGFGAEKQALGGRYNLLGQPVDENYHGIVIRNGQKRVQ